MNIHLPLLLCTLFTLSIGGRSAHADQFNSVAAGCVPGDPAYEFQSFYTNGSTVRHASGSTGLITMYCPIPVTFVGFTPGHLELTASDSSGRRSGPYVSASYIKMSKATGAITTVATVTTNGSVYQDGRVLNMNTTISDSYSSANYLYYVRVDLSRPSTTDSVVLYGITVY